MNLQALEIRVYDTVITCETLEKAEQFVLETIRNWYASESKIPLTITLSKIEDRGPPALNVNVNDGIGAKTGLA